MNILEKLQKLDRRWIFLFIGVGTIIPIIFGIIPPISYTPPVRSIFDAIEKLTPGDTVLVSFDYGPSSAPENDPQVKAVLRHCFRKKLKVVAIALYPLGGLTMAVNVTNEVSKEFEVEYSKDWVNLGYKDGGQASMKQMGVDIHGVFPTDNKGTKLNNLELMNKIHTYYDLKMVLSFSTGIIGEWWANLINAQFGIPVAVGCTAVSAPKYYAYLRAGQMLGLMGGLKAGAEYEKMLMDKYPEFKKTYFKPGSYNGLKGMTVQTVVHLIIILFIILGNIAYYFERKRKKTGGR